MCFINAWECDDARVWSESRPRARKRHRCHECRRDVHPGETYYRVRYLYDEVWSVYVCCSRCERVRQRLQEEIRTKEEPDIVVPFESLRCCLRERNSERRAYLRRAALKTAPAGRGEERDG